MASVLKGEKILVAPSSFAEMDPYPMTLLEKTGCEVIANPYKRKLTQEELLGFLRQGVTGLIAGLEALDYGVLKQSRLRVISRCGAGLSNVDMDGARRLGIQVASTPDAPTESVAELTLAMILNLLRSLPEMHASMRRGEWKRSVGFQLEGKAVWILGMGRIGRRLAELLLPFGAKLLATDSVVRVDSPRIRQVSFEEGLRLADVICVHVSGSECFLDARAFEQMKDGVFLLNASRGEVVDEEALYQAVLRNKVRGAWLDVFREEPYRGPLKDLDRVLLTPHVGSYTQECRLAMEVESVENLILAFQEQEVRHGNSF